MIEKEPMLKTAFNNLKAAKYMDLSDECFVNIAAFHVQQAIEMTLKSYLALKGIRYSKTHIVAELMEQCEDEALQNIMPRDIYKLEAYSIRMRYSQNHLADVKDIEKFIKVAEKLYAYVISIEVELKRGIVLTDEF